MNRPLQYITVIFLEMGCGGSQLSEADEDEGLPQVGHWDLEHGIDTVSTEKSQTGIVTMNVICLLLFLYRYI